VGPGMVSVWVMQGPDMVALPQLLGRHRWACRAAQTIEYDLGRARHLAPAKGHRPERGRTAGAQRPCRYVTLVVPGISTAAHTSPCGVGRFAFPLKNRRMPGAGAHRPGRRPPRVHWIELGWRPS